MNKARAPISSSEVAPAFVALSYREVRSFELTLSALVSGEFPQAVSFERTQPNGMLRSITRPDNNTSSAICD